MSAIPGRLWVCDAVGLLLAASLLYVGRKRRVGSEPHCPKCNYLLRGIQSDRCPECGTLRTAATAVRGEPKRRWTAFLAGSLVFLLISAFTIWCSIEDMQKVDWYSYKPAYFVLWDLNSNHKIAALRAWSELKKRDSIASLSAYARYGMAQFAMEQQTKIGSSGYFFTDFEPMNYLESRIVREDLPLDQKTKLFEQSVVFALEVRNKIIAGDLVSYEVTTDRLGPLSGDYSLELTTPIVCIDGKRADVPNSPDFGSTALFGNLHIFSCCNYNSPTPGEHELELTLRVKIFKGQFDRGTLVYSADQKLSASFEILPSKPDSFISSVFDPKLATAVKAAVGPPRISVKADGHSLDGDIPFNDPPVDLAYDVYASYAGEEQFIGRIVWTIGDGDPDYILSCELRRPAPTSMDIILRPTELAARVSVKQYSVWNQELIFHDVAVVKE
jgi:hypothetical protein